MEGNWYGPDKVAHFLFCMAVTFTGIKLGGLPEWAWWFVSLGVGLLWETTNHFFVLEGQVGVSILDALAFGFGWIVAGLVLYWRRER